jgi:hypothetical protein
VPVVGAVFKYFNLGKEEWNKKKHTVETIMSSQARSEGGQQHRVKKLLEVIFLPILFGHPRLLAYQLL